MGNKLPKGRVSFLVDFNFVFTNDEGDDVFVTLESVIVQWPSLNLAQQWAKEACGTIAAGHEHPLLFGVDISPLEIKPRVRRLSGALKYMRSGGESLQEIVKQGKAPADV